MGVMSCSFCHAKGSKGLDSLKKRAKTLRILPEYVGIIRIPFVIRRFMHALYTLYLLCTCGQSEPVPAIHWHSPDPVPHRSAHASLAEQRRQPSSDVRPQIVAVLLYFVHAHVRKVHSLCILLYICKWKMPPLSNPS